MLKYLIAFFLKAHTNITLLVCYCCVIGPLYANTPITSRPLTLDKAIEKTLAGNPQLHQFAFTQQRLLANKETSALSPGYSLGVDIENVVGTGEVSGFDRAETTVALSSVIELGGKRRSRIAVSNAQLNQLELEKQAHTLDVLGDLTSTFIQLLSIQRELALANEAVTLSEALFKTVQKRAQRGAASDAEVMRAKAMHTQTKIQQNNLHRKWDRQKVSLVRFWGESNVEFNSVKGDLFSFGESQNFSSLYEKVQHSPTLNVLASEQRLKEAEIRLAQSQNRANLHWQFGVRRFQDSGDTGIAVGFSMPLFSEGRNRHSITAAKAERNIINNQRTDRLLTLHDHLFTAYSQRLQFIEAHELLNQQVIPDLEKALKITREAYLRGRLKYQDWITAQQELLSAKHQLIETATAALLNQAIIEQLTAEPLTD